MDTLNFDFVKLCFLLLQSALFSEQGRCRGEFECFKMLLGLSFADLDLKLGSKGLRGFETTPFWSSKFGAFSVF